MRSLQQALQLEVDRGFGNLQGRRQRFSVFLAASLGEPPAALGPDQRQRLQHLSLNFSHYDDLPLQRRQSLVRQCRQTLQQLRQSLEPAAPMAAPRLRLQPASRGPAPAANSIELNTPLAGIQGVDRARPAAWRPWACL